MIQLRLCSDTTFREFFNVLFDKQQITCNEANFQIHSTSKQKFKTNKKSKYLKISHNYINYYSIYVIGLCSFLSLIYCRRTCTAFGFLYYKWISGSDINYRAEILIKYVHHLLKTTADTIAYVRTICRRWIGNDCIWNTSFKWEGGQVS